MAELSATSRLLPVSLLHARQQDSWSNGFAYGHLASTTQLCGTRRFLHGPVRIASYRSLSPIALNYTTVCPTSLELQHLLAVYELRYKVMVQSPRVSRTIILLFLLLFVPSCCNCAIPPCVSDDSTDRQRIEQRASLFDYLSTAIAVRGTQTLTRYERPQTHSSSSDSTDRSRLTN